VSPLVTVSLDSGDNMDVQVVEPCSTHGRLQPYLDRTRTKARGLPTRKVSCFTEHGCQVDAFEVIAGHEYRLDLKLGSFCSRCDGDALVIEVIGNHADCDLTEHRDKQKVARVDCDGDGAPAIAAADGEVDEDHCDDDGNDEVDEDNEDDEDEDMFREQHHLSIECCDVSYHIRGYSRHVVLEWGWHDIRFWFSTQPTGCSGCDTVWLRISYLCCDKPAVVRHLPLYLAGTELEDATDEEEDATDESSSTCSGDLMVVDVVDAEEDEDETSSGDGDGNGDGDGKDQGDGPVVKRTKEEKKEKEPA